MPESSSPVRFLHDQESDDWIVLNPTLSHKPLHINAEDGQCPFCPPRLFQHPLLAQYHQGTHALFVRANDFPVLTQTGDSVYGWQEVMVEGGAEHRSELDWSAAEWVMLLNCYAERLKRARQDPHIKCVIVFKNGGVQAGASQLHPHSQLWAMGFVPPRLAQEEKNRAYARRYRHTCQACLTLAREHAGALVIWEDERALCYAYATPRFPYEVRILPKRHVDHLGLLDEDERRSCAQALHACTPLIKRKGFAVNLYTCELVEDDDQHASIECIPRHGLFGGIELSAGLFINNIEPERAAREYRAAALL